MSKLFTLSTIGSRFIAASLIFIASLIVSAHSVSADKYETDKYETMDQSFEFRTGGTVKIESGVGEVKVEVWAEELVHLTAKKVEPAGHPVAQSDLAFFNTKSQLTVKSQPSDPQCRIDLTVYVPRNTNLRVTTTSGAVQIRGAVASVMVETKTGNINLESPASQNADLVMTTTGGKIRSALRIEPYGTPTVKALQGKLGSGGNPIILRSGDGNIQLAGLEREIDQDVATIPSAPPQTSSSDSPNNYRDFGNQSGGASNPNDNTLFGNNSRPPQRQPPRDDQPYNYGGNYGGGGLSGGNAGNTGASGQGRANTDVFGAGRDDDKSGSKVDLGGPGRNRTDTSGDIKGSFGVRIIPPPGSRPRDYNPDRDPNRDQQPDSSNQPQQPPPLRPRSNQDNPNDTRNDRTGNDDLSQNLPQDRPGDSRDANDYPDSADSDDAQPNRNRTVRPQPPVLRRGNQNDRDQSSPNLPVQQTGNNDDGTIKIDTNLVTLNVSVMDRAGRALTYLKNEDFQIFEDGVQQQISHFEPVNSPFNLVLVIDLSGSIIDKIDILRRAVIRFIEVTRPEDKVAIVAFTRSVFVVSDFTNDRQQLRQRLQYMQIPKGGTAFYEAMWFTLSQIIKPVEGERNAIVLLSDGVDNSISVTYPIPSRVTFEQIFRKTQESGAMIFPIYLDTEYENVQQEIESPESYVLARRHLSTLAEASGGVYIKAERVENLEGVYEKIAADLRTLYSVGYYPTNATRDGTWRKIKVKLAKGDVAVRTRRGYYAK